MDPGMVVSTIVKDFLKNKNNVINNQIIVIFYTPFTNNCQSQIEIWKCNMPVQHTSPSNSQSC